MTPPMADLNNKSYRKPAAGGVNINEAIAFSNLICSTSKFSPVICFHGQRKDKMKYCQVLLIVT
jgi:hypothetical protein